LHRSASGFVIGTDKKKVEPSAEVFANRVFNAWISAK
jgi:hypothetical protein